MNAVKRIVRYCVRNELIWRVLDATVLRVARYLDWAHGDDERVRRTSVELAPRTPTGGRGESLLSRAFPTSSLTLEVLGGPFAGLKYPARHAVGSELAPKLLGFYEWELQPIIAACGRRPYERVVDIGCAEGYYAVGLARCLKSATVYAIDIDPAGLRLCREMADLNAVTDRVITETACDAQSLVSLVAAGRTLIVSDCEGFEGDLFTAETVPALARHDLLIECHDFLRPGITRELRQRFEGTHAVVAVTSIPDHRKPMLYSSDALAPFTSDERLRLLAEHRPGEMVWLYMTPRHNFSD
ncbi:MAG: class I SAM-dependent methyltransferase [Gemmatimonadaceae bacterium]|nr:class I SAM-dependent methyltransferase [Gemmatimonadaceae bacterium]